MPRLREGEQGALALIEEWEPARFTPSLRARERVVVLFHADWCPFSRIFMRDFEDLEPEASVPFVRANIRHPLDPRWDDYNVRVVPTVAYFEHGEELERIESARGMGLNAHDLENFLETVEALNEEDRPRPRRRLSRRR